jgi:hypothetical protein
MALSRVAFGQVKVGAGTATATITINPSGSNLTAYIMISNENASAVSACSYDGVASTLIDSQGVLHMYYNTVTSGSKNVSVTRAATTGDLHVWVAIFEDSAQTGIPDAKDKGTGLTRTVTTVANNCLALMVARDDNAGMGAGTNSTEISTPDAYDAWAVFQNSTGAITPAGSYSMSFTGAGGTRSSIMVSIAPLVGYTMTAEVGTFTLTGQDANLLFGRKLIADVGSFVLTGFDAILRKGYILTAEVGTFALTGFDAMLLFGRKLIAETGAFVLTGFDATLSRGYRLIAEVGTFILTMGRMSGWLNIKRDTTEWTDSNRETSVWENTNREE